MAEWGGCHITTISSVSNATLQVKAPGHRKFGASDHPHRGGLLLTIIRVIAVAVVVVAIGLVDQPYSRLSRKSRRHILLGFAT